MHPPGKQPRVRIMPRSLRWLQATVAAILLVALGIDAVPADEATPAVAVSNTSPTDTFYDRPTSIPGAPGELLRSEALTDRVIPANSRAWRILYTSTAPDGSPSTAVATVLAPLIPPDGPMPVVAWDHGAVGLVQRCLPSVSPDPWKDMPALALALAQGWVVVATDYQTDADGVHPFLIGEGEARSTLDSVRALRQMSAVSVDDRTVVWGHSQGGHAALWAAILGQTYAPDVAISGVVAISPVTTLVTLLDRQRESSVAPMLAAFLATAYSSYYPELRYDTIVNPAALEPGRQLADRCPSEPLDGLEMALILGELGGEPLLTLPASEAFRGRLEENEPDRPFAVPVVIAQGLEDVIVLPQVTAEFVAARCADGATVSFWELPGQDHLSLVQPGSPLENPLIAWTQERFAGDAPEAECTTTTIGD